jgi:hypothetical protein
MRHKDNKAFPIVLPYRTQQFTVSRVQLLSWVVVSEDSNKRVEDDK